jgi:hypothetical protein
VVDGKRAQTASRASTLPSGFIVIHGTHLRIA